MANSLPGTVLAQRYRICARIGKGGMGEVYEAYDLILGQDVALKFLPSGVALTEVALDRFRHEVRLARQVSHPNVCRVYDIGEFDGAPFLSMEYVDGEDLASLLRRIGQLPADKALDIARHLCAGLDAAHEKGVLHRDLKPANIMINGRGEVLITDFGLAAIAGSISPEQARQGTTPYMSPEQLAGREVTVRSDIYALGLVLYEVFTGRRAFEAESVSELLRLQQESTPAGIRSVAKDVEPAVERAILRCLAADPQQRPSSAKAVARSLPIAGLLDAAVAAGYTPSPELVAEAGESGRTASQSKPSRCSLRSLRARYHLPLLLDISSRSSKPPSSIHRSFSLLWLVTTPNILAMQSGRLTRPSAWKPRLHIGTTPGAIIRGSGCARRWQPDALPRSPSGIAKARLRIGSRSRRLSCEHGTTGLCRFRDVANASRSGRTAVGIRSLASGIRTSRGNGRTS